MMSPTPLPLPLPLHEQLRSATAGAHRHVESCAFVKALLAGRLSRRGYALLLRSLHVVYASLESGLAKQSAHPLVRPILEPALRRADALASDLGFFGGANWADTLDVMPAAQRLAARMSRSDSQQAARLVAHAYVRYLGDLSGGQIMRRAVARGVDVRAGGTAFYDFGDAARVQQLAQALRSGLAAVPDIDGAHAVIVEEAIESFRLHGELFAELEQATAPTCET